MHNEVLARLEHTICSLADVQVDPAGSFVGFLLGFDMPLEIFRDSWSLFWTVGSSFTTHGDGTVDRFWGERRVLVARLSFMISKTSLLIIFGISSDKPSKL